MPWSSKITLYIVSISRNIPQTKQQDPKIVICETTVSFFFSSKTWHRFQIIEFYENGWSLLFAVQSLSCVQLFATPGTAACQAPRSVGFPRQEYWGGLPFPSPGDLPDPGIEPTSPAFSGGFLTTELAGRSVGCWAPPEYCRQ